MPHPMLNRTSPKGERFVGTCPACGRAGLTLSDLNGFCENQREMTAEDALLAAVAGTNAKEKTDG